MSSPGQTPANKILIVDDEEKNRRLLELVLRDRGYVLEFARDGAEALRQVQVCPPDLILLDVMMPEMDGFEVCRQVRAHPRLSEIPILLVTALDDKQSRLQGIEAGADDFLSKPIDRLEMQVRVQSILRLNRFRRMQMERAKFEVIAQQSQDGYVQIDPEGEILYANRQARVYLGLPLDTPEVSQHFMALARRRYVMQPQAGWQHWPLRVSGQARIERYLLRPETSTAQALWLQVDVLPMPAGADAQLLQLRDVTEQLGTQRDIWRFHALLSHKLRTPLVGLIGSLDCVTDDPDIPRKELQELIATAKNSANRLRLAVSDVLRFMETPSLGASVGATFPLTDLTALTGQIATRLGIEEVTTALETGLGSSALTLSSITVDTLLSEILENSMKFHPSRTPSVTITAFRPEDGRVALRIADDGQTLSPDQIEQVWKPYYQGEKEFTGEVSGMGLGLAMVAFLVWEKGGECRMINRDPGPGVVVELLLPLAA